MYEILTVEDEVAVKPEKFAIELEKSIKESIEEKYEGMIDTDIGIILGVCEILEVGDGKILPGDPCVHYSTKFKIMVWMPKLHELIEGEAVDITEWGAFIRIGPFDGLVHISQVMDDFVSFDEKNQQLFGKSSRRTLKVGDKVRTRVISISLKEQNKVGLTMRQPFLGSAKWLSEPVVVEKKQTRKEKKAKKK